MRILVGWDDPDQAELINLYLSAGDNAVIVATKPEQLLTLAGAEQHWDVILISTSLPDIDASFELFQKINRLRPETPIVGACFTDDVYRIARFMTAGMRAYVIRDEAGDFVFLLQATLESAVAAVMAEREKLISAKLREEVESVRKLQESIIPADLQCPEGYHMVARYESSQIRVLGGQPVTLAGGDYYDVFTPTDESMIMLVGDASGHGMKACMSIMTMHTLIRMIRSNKYNDTASFVEEVNRHLCDQTIVNEDGGFITLLYAILQQDTNELQWTSAGHPFPMLQNMEDNTIRDLGGEDDGGFPLGIVPDAEYSIQTTFIPPKSRLLIYTDGLAEAFPDGQQGHSEFGIKGIVKVLQESRDLPLDETLASLFAESHAFTKGQGRHDDTSVVLMERS
ncbi:MAG: SpoIIE family protein phosphatase [Planctomycetes bacterium]|nr:SpoIIE family protein phosphatase [Planctomycetota bacterium]